MKSRILWMAIVLLTCFTGRAQNVTVSSAVGQNPQTLINQHLAGEGVKLTNGKFNNSTANISSAQIGTFSLSATANSFPFHSGLVMTTGNVSVAAGPNSASSESNTSGVVTYTDAQLSPLISPYPVNNSAALDFDFVAYSDTFAFSYIFGSEEYPEYACSSFNDAFAFFLSGPDPVTYANMNRNVAIIPNTITAANPNGVPVTINNINQGAGANGSSGNCHPQQAQFAQYYHNNPSGSQGVEYDGYTVALTAEATILACETYHMHLAICNTQDNAYDSGVFLKEGSFYSPTMEVFKDYNIDPQGQTIGDTLIQNCRDLDIRLQLPRQVLQGIYHTDIQFLGDAIYGVDYDLMLNNQPVNQVEAQFNFQQGTDHLNFQMRMLPTATCDNGVKQAILILNTVFCDQYEDARRADTLYFYLKCNDTIRLRDTSLACCHLCDNISVELESGADDLLYQWLPATGIDNPNAPTSTADITENRTYQVVAKDRYGCLADTATVDVTIHEQPEVDLRITPDHGCAPLGVNLRTMDMPEDCQIYWHVTNDTIFDHVDSTSNPLLLTLDSAGYYDVYLWLSTAPGCSDSITLGNAIRVSGFPHASFTFSPEEASNGETVYFYDNSTGGITEWHWNFGDNGTSTEQNPEHAYHLTASDNMTVRLTVANEDGCSDDTSAVVPVIDDFALYVPSAFTPSSGDDLNKVFQPKVNDVAYYRLEIYDRNGNLFFVTEDTETPWDGTVGGHPAPTGVYVYVIRYIRYSNVNRVLQKKGSVTLLR